VSDVVLSQPRIVIVVPHAFAVQEYLVNTARRDVEAGALDGLPDILNVVRSMGSSSGSDSLPQRRLWLHRKDIAPVRHGEPGVGRNGVGIDSPIEAARQILAEKGVVGDAVIADRNIAERGILAWSDGETDVAEHSEGNVISARTHGFTFTEFADPPRPPEPAGGPPCPPATGCPGAAVERGFPVDRNRNLPKGASEFDDMFRVFVGVVDHVGRDVESPHRLRRRIGVLVAGAVDMKLRPAVRRTVDRGDVKFQLDVALIFAALDP